MTATSSNMSTVPTHNNNNNNNNNKNIIVFDGGTGREIERCGGPFRQPEWSALALYDKPQVVREVHRRFLKAGAHAITTNTYAIVPFHLGQERYRKDARRLLQLAVDLAHEAVVAHADAEAKSGGNQPQPQQPQPQQQQKKAKIFGSIPPLCGSYEPEKFNEADAGPILQDFLHVLGNDDRIDVLLLETVGSLHEARFYLQHIREFYAVGRKMLQSSSSSSSSSSPLPPIWLSFCVKADYGFHQKPTLLSGESLAESIQALAKEGAFASSPPVNAILINCCDIRLVKESIQEIQAALKDTDCAGMRMGAYPNAFSIPPPDKANHTLRQVDYNITPNVIQSQGMDQLWSINSGRLLRCRSGAYSGLSCFRRGERNKWRKRR